MGQCQEFDGSWTHDRGGIRQEIAAYNILIKAAAEARLPEAAEYWFFQARKEGAVSGSIAGD